MAKNPCNSGGLKAVNHAKRKLALIAPRFNQIAAPLRLNQPQCTTGIAAGAGHRTLTVLACAVFEVSYNSLDGSGTSRHNPGNVRGVDGLANRG